MSTPAISRPGALRDCASLLRRTLNRIRSVTDSFHLVVHTAPNTQHQSKALNYWRTIDEDYHWHIEILPILAGAAEIVLVQGKLSLGGDAGGGSGAAAGSADGTHADHDRRAGQSRKARWRRRRVGNGVVYSGVTERCAVVVCPAAG